MKGPFVAAPLLAAALGAQIPNHAVLLNPTLPMAATNVVQNGDDVHVFGFYEVGVGTLDQLIHATSYDGGRTWPILEQAIGPPSNRGNVAALALDSGVVVVVTEIAFTGIVSIRSADRGMSWGAPTVLSGSVAPLNPQFSLLLAGDAIVATWGPEPSVATAVSRRSLDGGVSWQPTQSLGGTATSISRLEVVANGDWVDAIWFSPGSAGVRRQRSIDAGATWLPVATPVPVAFGYESFASNGTDIIITSTIGTPAVSHDGGASWSVLSIPGFATARQVANEGDVFVAAGFVAGTNAFYEINVSGDGGQTWLPHPQPVASTTPFPAIYTPTIVDGTVFVDFAFVPNADILMSQDRGTSWQTVAGPAGWGFWVGSRRTMHLARDLMFPNPGGPASLWAYAGLGTTSLGGAAAGAGGIEPSLSLDGLPFQGSMPNLVVDDVVGGSLGVLAVSLAPPQPLPLGNALTIWPTVAPILCAYPTRGVAGRAGTGSFAMPLIVPVDPQLANTSLTTQAVVIDRAHPDGFVASEALEVWLR